MNSHYDYTSFHTCNEFNILVTVSNNAFQSKLRNLRYINAKQNVNKQRYLN